MSQRLGLGLGLMVFFFPRLNILTRDLLTNDSFEPHWEERWLLVLQNRTKER